MSLQIGQTIKNKYRIERLLGEGGFGYVYEATDLSLQRRVAIKELKEELASNPEAFNRFVNEAVAIANLRNPYIVTMLNREQEGNHHYMIMEYMDGGSLAGLLAKRGTLSPGEAAKITKAVCDGLAAAHQKDIVHRDIKPANILMSRDGQSVKISDFGIAHVPSAVTGQANLTRTGTAMGTPWYMSPEQARGQRVDARGDLYAVGVMLYEMVAGYRYLDFTSDFFGDLEKLKTTPPRPLPATVPKGLQQIIAGALAKDPLQRFQSAEEMSAALQAFITPGVTIAMPQTPSSARGAQAPISRQRSSPFLIVGAIAAMVLILLLVVVLSRLAAPQATTVAVIAGPTASPLTQATALPTTDIQALVAQSMLATQTAQKVAGSTLAAQVAASLTAAAPTATRTPMPTLPPTLTPSPTQTSTVTPLPTSSPTPPLPPGVYVTNIRLEPPNPSSVQSIQFFVTFQNTAGPLKFRWCVYIFKVGQSNQIGQTTCDIWTDFPIDTHEYATPNTWKLGSGTPCTDLTVQVEVFDTDGHLLHLKKPDGSDNGVYLRVCP